MAAAGGDDAVDGISVWDTTSGTLIHRLIGHEDWPTDAAFRPDGAVIATSSFDADVKLWDAESGTEIRTLVGHDAITWGMEFSRDGSRLVTTSDAGTARVWDVEGGRELTQLNGHYEGVFNGTFSPVGSLVATDSDDGTIRVWDVTPTGIGEIVAVEAHEAGTSNATFDPSNARFATSGNDGLAHIWDAVDGTLLATLTGHEWPVSDIEWGLDGTWLATAGEDGTVRTWDAATGTQTAILIESDDSSATSAALSGDGGRVLATWADGSATITDVAASETLIPLPNSHELAVADGTFRPDSTEVATASDDGYSKVWDATSGAEKAALCCHEFGAFSVDYSPDGTRLLTSGEDAVARVWEVGVDGTPVPTVEFVGHQAGLTDAVFGPDGLHVATSSSDGTVRLWDSLDGSELLRLATGAARSVEFSHDGNHLLVGTDSGAALILTLDVDELVELAHQRLTRWWTATECRRYLHTEACPSLPQHSPG